MNIKDLFRRVYRSRLGMRQDTLTPHVHAKFHLIYNQVKVGELRADDGYWTFEYTDEFRKNQHLRPLVEFPDTKRTYESEELWPFFGTRIPSLKRTTVREIVREEDIDEKDQIQLLRRFGKRTVANPYVLVESTT